MSTHAVYALTSEGRIDLVQPIRKSELSNIRALAKWLCHDRLSYCAHAEPDSIAAFDAQVETHGYCDDCLSLAGRLARRIV